MRLYFYPLAEAGFEEAVRYYEAREPEPGLYKDWRIVKWMKPANKN